MTDRPISGGHPALTDDETGLPNRLHFDTVFQVVFATAPRGVPISVLLLEIEGFKEWMARTGPDEQIRILRTLGSTLSPLVRMSDLLARSGEDRFNIGLVDCNLAGAILVADRIDSTLDNLRASTGLAFNIGGAVFDMDMHTPEDLLDAAEDALQAAATKGVNQTEFYR